MLYTCTTVSTERLDPPAGKLKGSQAFFFGSHNVSHQPMCSESKAEPLLGVLCLVNDHLLNPHLSKRFRRPVEGSE